MVDVASVPREEEEKKIRVFVKRHAIPQGAHLIAKRTNPISCTSPTHTPTCARAHTEVVPCNYVDRLNQLYRRYIESAHFVWYGVRRLKPQMHYILCHPIGGC